MADRTREEHLEWSKQRARRYVDEGELNEALTSMFSDLTKHQELKEHIGIQLGVQLMMIGSLNDRVSVLRFIDGFN